MLEAGKEPSAGKADFPADGVDAENLTRELYRHFGAMVPFEAIRKDYDQIVEHACDDIARALIQQRERLHDLAYANVSKLVEQLCPPDVHPDEWDVEGLEKSIASSYQAKIDLTDVPESLDHLIDLCWDAVEGVLYEREKEYGLYTYLYHIRHIWLNEIDAQWIAHLKNIEHLRTGIGLVGYATRNPKNEYKIRGYNLFRDMWEGIEQTVLDKVVSMKLTEQQRREAEEGAEYETALTRASQRRAAGAKQRGTASRAQLDKLQEAARRAMQQLQQTSAQLSGAATADAGASAKKPAAIPEARPNDPCPCGSGKRYKKCHGKRATA